MPTPAVCRAVHYVSFGTPSGEYTSQCRAAVIAEVGAWVPYSMAKDEEQLSDGRRSRTRREVWEPEACALHISNPTGLYFNTCLHDEGRAPGTWHWPERVDDPLAVAIPEQPGGP